VMSAAWHTDAVYLVSLQSIAVCSLWIVINAPSYSVSRKGQSWNRIFFILFTADLLGLVETHGLRPHLYADDTQIFGSCCPGDTSQLQSRVPACIDDVALC